MDKSVQKPFQTLWRGVAALALAAGGSGAAAAAPGPEALAQQAGCQVCHLAARRHIGPSWQEIAVRHRGDPKAAATLAARVRQGSTGVWGPVPMPSTPKDKLGDAQVAQVVAWILAR